jgi:hypothetical protein
MARPRVCNKLRAEEIDALRAVEQGLKLAYAL